MDEMHSQHYQEREESIDKEAIADKIMGKKSRYLNSIKFKR